MKKIYTFLVAVLLTVTTFAQAPEKMSYQAVVRDSGDALVANQAIGMQISILQTSAIGAAVYVETQTTTSNVNGLVTLEIGTGSVVSGNFTTIDWSADSYFIKTETDPTGGSNYSITGTSQLLSVPYALHAKTADNVTNSPLSFNTTSGTGIQSPSNTASGSKSVALGNGTTASAQYSTSMGNNTQANGNYSTSMGWNTIANGWASTAMGANSMASGFSSTALGNSTASGDASTSMGENTIASGTLSTTMGRQTVASGYASTAMGFSTTASDLATLSIGQYNTDDTTPNPGVFNLSNTAFVIGNGLDAGNKSDALTVLFDGTTTINGDVTATSFTGDGSGLTNLPSGFSGDYNDLTNRPLSFNTTSGSGIQSPSNTASGISSSALGSGTTASGVGSTAMGYSTVASGNLSTAIGVSSIASGNGSTAMGIVTTALDFGTFAIGQYNTNWTASPTIFLPTNRAFIIGNGIDASNKSDAMTVLFDGTTTINGDVTATSFSGDGSGLTNLQTELPTNANTGDMSYWNGSAWVIIAATPNEGATLQMIGGVPAWTGGTPPTPAAIGDFRDGGVVFWVDPTDNTQGLVCAIEDQSTGIQWWNGDYIVTGATATAIGTGAANTDAIIAVQGAVETNYAAGLARAYTGGGFDDWYLPSKDELNAMYLNKATIDATATANGGSIFPDSYYWSSMEHDNLYAWQQYFYDGFQFSYYKSATTNSVRAVRAF